MTREKYSEEFKDAIVTKMFNRGSQTISEVCRQEGVSKSAVRSWQEKRDNGLGMKTKRSRDSQQWPAEVKLNAVLQGNNLGEEDFGVFLRKEGLHSHQVKAWRADILTALGPLSGRSGSMKDGRDQRILELEKDLHRKDKALAEASALLILQKKVNLIWEKESEGEK